MGERERESLGANAIHENGHFAFAAITLENLYTCLERESLLIEMLEALPARGYGYKNGSENGHGCSIGQLRVIFGAKENSI